MNGEISTLLQRYGTSLAETRKLMPRLTEAVRRKRVTTPRFFTAEEAREFGYELEPGWSLKVKPPVDGQEPKISYISPTEWELTDFAPSPGEPERWIAQTYITPSGEERFTLEQMKVKWAEAEELEKAFGVVFPEREIGDVEDLLAQMAISEDMPVPERIRAERAQDEFLGALQEIGRTEDTEELLRGLGATEEQIGELFKVITVEPEVALNEVPLGAYRLSQQPLDKLTEFAAKDPDGLRQAMLFEGRSETTENLLRQIYGTEVITDKYLNSYFQDTVAGGFVRGEWLPDVLEDYWKLYFAGVADFVLGVAGLADRVGADSVSQTLKNIALEGQLIVVDVDMGKPGTPTWYAKNLARMVPFILGIVDTALVTAGGAMAVTKAAGAGTFLTRIVGTITGGVTSAVGEGVIEAGHGYYEAENRGFSKAERNAVFDQILRENIGLLSLTNTAQFGAAFMLPGGATARLMVKVLLFPLQAVTEGIEEGGQLFITRRALDDPVLVFDEEFWQNFKLGMAGGLFFQGIGTVYTSIQSRAEGKMSDAQKLTMDQDIAEGMLQGLSRKEAESRALDKFAETKEGEAIVTTAVEEIVAEEKAKAIPDVSKVEDAIKPIVDKVKPISKRADALAEEHLEKQGVVPPKVKPPVVKPPKVPEAEAVERALYEMQEEVRGLKEWLTTEPASKLIGLIKKAGWYKGEISNLTVKQFRDITGETEIKPNILTPDKKHVYWEYALDGIATEMGYKTGEDLKFAIERVGEAQTRIKELQRQIAVTAVPAVPEVKEVPPEKGLIRERVQKVSERYKRKEEAYDQVKKTLYDIAKSAPLEVRGKMLVQMKNVRTEAQLTKAIDRLGRLAEEYDQRVLRGQVKKELRRTKAKKYEGILKGKYTPEVQEKLDIIRKNLEVDRDLAREKIADNIHAYEKGEISYEEMLEANELLNMAGIDGMSSQELKGVLENIKSLKETGKAIREEARAKEKERIDAIKTDVIGVITGGKGLKPGIVTVPARQLEATKGWLEKLVNWQYSLTNLMDKLSKFHKTKPYQSPLSKFVDNAVLRSRDTENTGLERAYAKVRENFSRVFKTTNRGQINQILNKFQNEEVNLGTFKNLDGEVVTLRLTKDQIMNKYQQLQDPTLEATFTDGMRWSADIKQAIVNNLSEQEKAWADYQMEFYQEYYDSINEIYSEMFGVDLPHNLNYSPVKRDLEAEVPENVLTYKDISRYASVLNGSLKSRVQNKIPLRFNGSTGLLVNHVQQMEHFKAWAGTMRDMRRVLGDKGVRTAIRQYHGQPILKTIDGYLNDIARGGMEKASINRGADFLRRNFVRAVLGVKPVIALKQIPSVIAYSTEMPIGDFVGGVADFWTSPIKHYRFMLERSPYMRQRFGRGFERDIKFAMERGPARTLSGMGNAKDWFMALIRQGDKFAVTQGSWAKYKSEMKGKPKTEENMNEAMLSAEQSTRRTQPTFDIETLSPLQKGGSWVRLLTMFQNQPNKYFRIMADNARNFQYGRGNRAKAVSNILLVWVVAPALFQFVADAFQFKKEHQLRAWVLGPLNWVLIFSQFAQSVYGWVTDEPFDYQASPVFQTARDIQIGIMKAMKMVRAGKDPYENINMDDAIAMTEYFAKAAGELLGYPTPWLVQAERGIREGEPLEIIFSRWSLRKPEKDDRGKALDAVGNLAKTKLDIDLASEEVETRRKAEKEAKEREEAEAKGLTVEPLDIFDMGDLDNEMNRIYGDTLPDDVIADKKSPPEAVAWAEMAKSRAIANTQPDIPLYKINTDKEKDDTIIHYYKQWQAREKIDNLADLTEFDKLYPNANLGNVTRRQYDLLVKYLETPADKKKQFVEDHPELKEDLRDKWLKANPIDNARLAVWGEAKILTQEAYDEIQRLIKTLDIPDDAIPKFTLPPEGSVENYFKYLEVLEQPGMAWNSWESQIIWGQDDALREFLEYDPLETPIASLEIKTEPKYREIYDKLEDKDYLDTLDDETKDPETGLTKRAAYIAELKATQITDEYTYRDLEKKVEAIEKGTEEAPISDEIVNAHVEYHRLLGQEGIGATSAEVMLFRVDNAGYNASRLDKDVWGSDAFTEDVDKSQVPKWRLQVKYRSEDEEYDVTIPKKYEDMTDDVINALPAPKGMNEAYWERQTADKKRDILIGIDRDEILAGNEIYRTDRLRIKAYEKDFPDIEGYVTYYELPGKGYRRKRMLIEDKRFGEAMHEIAGIDLPDPKEVPSVRYDEITERWQADFDKLESLANHKSEYYIEDVDKRNLAREAMRFKQGKLTEFGKAEIRRKGYKLFVPEKYIDRFVEFDSIRAEDKPEWYDRGIPEKDRIRYFEDEWYLWDHPLFYKDIYLGLLGLEEIDFSKVPTPGQRYLYTPGVFDLYRTYLGIPKGEPQLNFRARHTDLDALGVLEFGWTPIGERGRKEVPKTPWEKAEEIKRFKEKF